LEAEMAELPPPEELEQMSMEELDALAAQVAGGAPLPGPMDPAMAEPMPEAPMEEAPMPEAAMEELPGTEAPPMTGVEEALAGILSATADASMVVQQLREAGFKIVPADGPSDDQMEAMTPEAEEEASAAAELVEGAEEAGDAAEEEPKNMKERRQRAARNALEKNA
jgi:hypothetical protein